MVGSEAEHDPDRVVPHERVDTLEVRTNALTKSLYAALERVPNFSGCDAQ